MPTLAIKLVRPARPHTTRYERWTRSVDDHTIQLCTSGPALGQVLRTLLVPLSKLLDLPLELLVSLLAVFLRPVLGNVPFLGILRRSLQRDRVHRSEHSVAAPLLSAVVVVNLDLGRRIEIVLFADELQLLARRAVLDGWLGAVVAAEPLVLSFATHDEVLISELSLVSCLSCESVTCAWCRVRVGQSGIHRR